MAIERVVVADDEFLNRQLLEEILGRLGMQVETAKDGLHALRALEAKPADLLITDIRMPGMGGMKLLLKAREKWPDLPVVMMTAFASVESAVESMRQGAYDYLMKPFGVEQVEALLLRLNERQQLVREVRVLRQEVRDRHRARSFLGDAPAMREVFATIDRAAASTATVLVHGESGTGKELVARALHEQSPRADGPFVKVNCAALTESLLTSELFGHEKGAFTGAVDQRIGRFELADGGTLFLDEISEISPDLQAKLLRVLEEREFERVGGSKPISTDVRIIATTNRDLLAQVRDGGFREDLYYRLNVIPIALPPLRQRREDIPAIAEHYFAHFAREMALKKSTIDAAALEALAAYDWPGNVRELVNIIERLVVLGGGRIDAATLRRCLPEMQRRDDPPGAGATDRDSMLEDLANWSLAEVEARHIKRVLEAQDGNKQAAAKVLGISPRTLHSKLAKTARS